jgi:hypothetical protein
MTAASVRTALGVLRLEHAELADELGVSERTVRRWCADGCDGANAWAIRGAMRFESLGIAWRRGQVAIAIGPGGSIEKLTDVQAVARRQALRETGLLP